jgi:hypothetical protein
MRNHCFVIEGLTLRRVADGRRTLPSALRPTRRYELHYPSGEHRVVTLDQLDAALDGRSFPADYWACVNAADEAFVAGNTDVLIEWPSGRRTNLA